jgi:hypothetical protein
LVEVFRLSLLGREGEVAAARREVATRREVVTREEAAGKAVRGKGK